MEKLPINRSEYLQKLNDSLGAVVFTIKVPERVIEYTNRAIENVFGYKPDECIGKKTKIFYPSVEEYHDFGRSLKSAIKEGKDELRVERLFKRKNGEIFPCEVTTTFLKENEKNVRCISILQDITEHKRAEDLLREKEQQMRLFMLSTNDSIWNWDMVTGTVGRSIGFERAFGYKTEEMHQGIEWWSERLHPDDKERIWQTFNDAVAGGKEFCVYEYRFRCRDGSYANIEDRVCIIRDDTGKVVRSLGAMRDITERVRAGELVHEQKKVLEQKNIALSEILGQIEIEKKQIKDNVIANAENLLLPIIQKLRLKGESRKYVQLLRKNLQELTSSFGKKLIERETRLTSREIEICNMIKNGITSREIASLLDISLGTAERHRNNIRKKLDIVNKDINLSTVLKRL